MEKEKKDKFTKEQFLDLFREIKTKKKGYKCKIKGLSEADERNFKRLIKRGYDIEDFTKALEFMFDDTGQWAVNSNNDIPTHFLRSEVFDRYLNGAEKKEELKTIKEAELKEKNEAKGKIKVEEKTQVPFKGLSDKEEEELLQKAKDNYTLSLSYGEWVGMVMDASKIISFFSSYFTLEEKKDFESKGKIEAQNAIDTEKKGEEAIQSTLNRMARSRPFNAMCELVIIEAVKRKIKEPWLNNHS